MQRDRNLVTGHRDLVVDRSLNPAESGNMSSEVNNCEAVGILK